MKLEELRQHKEEIEREERELDEQCQRMKQCLKNITDDTYSDEYPLRSLSFLLSLSPPSLPSSLSLPPSFCPSISLYSCGYFQPLFCNLSILDFPLVPPLPLLLMMMSANYQHSKVPVVYFRGIRFASAGNGMITP